MKPICRVCDINYARLQDAESKLHKAQRTIVEQMKTIEELRQQLSIARSLTVKAEREREYWEEVF